MPGSGAPPQRPASLLKGCANLLGLQLQDLAVREIDFVLVVHLLAIELQPVRMNLKHRGLVADLLRLLAEGQDREGGRDDREGGEQRGGDGGDLARQVR